MAQELEEIDVTTQEWKGVTQEGTNNDPSSNTKAFVVQEAALIRDYVDEEHTALKLHDHNILKTIKGRLNQLVNTINSIPERLYNNTIDVAQNISENLYQYADAMSGDSMDMSDVDIDSFMLDKAHIQYIDKLRKNNKEAYDKALASYASLAGKGLPKDTKTANVVSFFQTNSKDFIVK